MTPITTAILTATVTLVIAIGSGKLDGFVDLLTRTYPRMMFVAVSTLLLATIFALVGSSDPREVMFMALSISTAVRGYQRHHSPDDTNDHDNRPTPGYL